MLMVAAIKKTPNVLKEVYVEGCQVSEDKKNLANRTWVIFRYGFIPLIIIIDY